MKLKKITEMSFGERGREIERLRRAIIRFVNLKDNAKCHLEDDRLARSVGLKRAARSTITKTHMLRMCHRYVNRECRAGRIADNLVTIPVQFQPLNKRKFDQLLKSASQEAKKEKLETRLGLSG